MNCFFFKFNFIQTLYPNENNEWSFNPYEGFRINNVSTALAGNRSLCQGVRDAIEEHQVFEILIAGNNKHVYHRILILIKLLFVLDIKLTSFTESSVVVQGDTISLQCESFKHTAIFEWTQKNGTVTTISPKGL